MIPKTVDELKRHGARRELIKQAQEELTRAQKDLGLYNPDFWDAIKAAERAIELIRAAKDA